MLTPERESTRSVEQDVAAIREATGYGWGYGDEAQTEVELAKREVIVVANEALDRLQAAASERDALRAQVAALEEAGEGLLEDAIPLLEVDVSDEVWLESKHRLLAAFARWREASSGAGSHQTHGQRADSSDKARPAPETPEVKRDA